WFTGEPDALTPEARDAIVDADTVVVSAASIWEISTKTALGKLRPPVDDLVVELQEWGFEMLPITAQHAWAVGRLPRHHRDPFDRMLVTQAQLEGLTIVTRDPAISRYQVAVLEA
ncbi:MAG TPA: type II toxin-antitoxin system VapC family toxin, partial [Gaiellaceae bacterium]|nr:type II toxin-antitoxin system VapC family toxin [Gaiellaceae bacterium]